MVIGLEKFKEHFAGYSDQYVLIGGTACFLLFDEAELPFRITKDLDIVLCIEALSQEFVTAFFNFISAGNYRIRERSTGEKMFYRFDKPEDKTYPIMIELFSGRLEGITLPDDSTITPILIDDELVSLSALLLEPDYNDLILKGKREINGIPVLKPEYLLILKAKAWMDLTDRKIKGGQVDGSDIKKHLDDVFRLFVLLNSDMRISLSGSVKADLQLFIARYTENPLEDISRFGISATQDEVINTIKQIYQIEG